MKILNRNTVPEMHVSDLSLRHYPFLKSTALYVAVFCNLVPVDNKNTSKELRTFMEPITFVELITLMEPITFLESSTFLEPSPKSASTFNIAKRTLE